MGQFMGTDATDNVFTFTTPGLMMCPSPDEAENALFARAAAGEPCAQLWQTAPALIVPASYKRFPLFEPTRQALTASTCPVYIRKSGGGLVPQGPGIINISLAWPTSCKMGEAAEAVYLYLCGLLQQALRDIGVETGWQAVEGSFCDGRYNLACGEGANARKIAGTAQYWRVIPGQPEGAARRHVVLVHAVLLVACDLEALHCQANAFEAAIASGRVYDPAKTVTVAQAAPDAALATTTLVERLIHRIQHSPVPDPNPLN